MKRILAIIAALLMSATPKESAIVDRIEGNHAIIEVANGQEIKMAEVPTEEFNNPVAEGNKISASTAVGAFEGNQFKSYDDTVWWYITEEELGFVPEANKTYTLVFYDNGTKDCAKCPEEFNCECEVYDDIFLALFEGGN